MTSNAIRDALPSDYSLTAITDLKKRSAPFHAASHAFSQTPGRDNALSTQGIGTNAAVAAASTAGLGRRKEKKLSEGAYFGQQPNNPSPNGAESSGASNILRGTNEKPRCREQSPSHVAALLATKSKVTPTREALSGPAHQSSFQRPSPLASVEDLRLAQSVDGSPTRDANTLIKLFESNQKTQAPAPIVHSVRYINKKTTPSTTTREPESVRSAVRSVSSTTLPLPPVSNPPIRTRGDTTNSLNGSSVATVTSPAVNLGESSSESKIDTRSRAVSARQGSEYSSLYKTGGSLPLDGSQESHESSLATNRIPKASEPSVGDPTERFLDEVTEDLKSRPSRSPARPTLPKRYTEPAVLPLGPSKTSASRPALVTQQTSTETSDPVRPVRRSVRVSDSYVPQLSVNSLANAMVASSLASSRAPSPSKPPPLPPPPRHHGKHSFIHYHHKTEDSRTPSPAKGMRQTMREPLKSDDESDNRKHRTYRMRKHHNKHHEGDRKRYRNEVNERERKRYEGVWAANRGLLLSADESNAVVNIVVRDIWKRSCLPDDVLEEIWDLVDN